MTRGETAVVLAACSVGVAVPAFQLGLRHAGFLRAGFGALLGFDLFGGAVCNATDTTKRWYHRDGTGVRSHLRFVIPHLLYIAAVAALFRGVKFDAGFFWTVGTTLLATCAGVLAAPRALKRPVAAGLYLLAMALIAACLPATPGLEWFVPALFFKLLIGHLVPISGARM